jgi:hypothetical protein
MRNSIVYPILMFVMLLSATAVFCQEQAVESHWSPYLYPSSIPEDSRIHIIVKGDTLWDIAQQYYDNPYLWPHLHESNQYISDPHKIYPGDPVVLADLVVLDPGEGEAITDIAVEAELPTPNRASMPADESVIYETEPTNSLQYEPLASEPDLYCSANIYAKKLSADITILGGEEDKQMEFMTGDIIYLSNDKVNLQPNEMYISNRYLKPVSSSLNNAAVGFAYQQIGIVKVILVNENFAVAELVMGCAGVRVGDILLPYQKLANPLVHTPQPIDVEQKYLTSLDEPVGSVVFNNNDSISSGMSYVTYIDLGSEDGIDVGDKILFFSESSLAGRKDTVRRVTGTGYVIQATSVAASVKINFSEKPIFAGVLAVKEK